MTIKLGTVNTYKASLASYCDTASTTHTCAVHHDSVQRYVCGDFVLLGQQAAELHHDSRTDGKALVHLLALNNFLHTNGYHTLFAIRAIVGHDDNLV